MQPSTPPTLDNLSYQRLKEQHPLLDREWLLATKWYEDVFRPDGYITLTFISRLPEEKAHKLVALFFNKVAKKHDTHILWEAYWANHPNSDEHNKVHYHVFYRFDGQQVCPRRMDAAWGALVRKHRFGHDVRYADDLDMKALAKTSNGAGGTCKLTAKDKAGRKSSMYLGNADAYRYLGENPERNMGTRFKYVITGHPNSIVGTGCPHKTRACRRKCKHRKQSDSYWSSL